MKKYIYIFIAIAVLGVLALFFTPDNFNAREGANIKVAATIFPLYDIVRNVAGDNAEVELLLPPGASAHFYEFTPRQLAGLQGTELIFAIGYGIDDWSLKAVDAIDGVEAVLVDEGIELRESMEEEEHEEHGAIDPHYWLHFGNARIMSDTIAEHLGRIDPKNANAYRENAEAYKAALSAEEENLKIKIQPLQQRNIATFHDAFFYFADNFGLNIVGTFEPSAGVEPTPKYLAALQEEIREQNVSIIFSEPQISNAAFTSFIRDNGLGFGVLDPIGGTGGINSYVELMRYNINTAIAALGTHTT